MLITSVCHREFHRICVWCVVLYRLQSYIQLQKTQFKTFFLHLMCSV